MDYPSLWQVLVIVSAVLVLSCGQTDDTQKHTDADEFFTAATLVGMSNDYLVSRHSRPSSI